MNPESTLTLLGAGASRDAGLLVTNELSKAIVRGVKKAAVTKADVAVARQLDRMYKTMVRFERARTRSGPKQQVDVERLFSAVEMLRERPTLEITPFVKRWLRLIQMMDPQTDPQYAAKLSHSAFAEHSWAIRQQLRLLLKPVPKKLGYLRKLVSWVGPGGTIATLNYDLALEEAVAQADVGVDDSLDSLRDDVWNPDPNKVGLLKLHGSIDWHIQHSNPYLGLEFTNLQRDDNPYENAGNEPAIIFGTRGKLRAEGPYLAMLRSFREKLLKSETLIVIGYSFRDEHINHNIHRFLIDRGKAMLEINPSTASTAVIRHVYVKAGAREAIGRMIQGSYDAQIEESRQSNSEILLRADGTPLNR